MSSLSDIRTQLCLLFPLDLTNSFISVLPHLYLHSVTLKYFYFYYQFFRQCIASFILKLGYT